MSRTDKDAILLTDIFKNYVLEYKINFICEFDSREPYDEIWGKNFFS